MTKDAEMAARRARWGDGDIQFITDKMTNHQSGLTAEDRLRQLPPESNLSRHCRGYSFGALESGEDRLGYPKSL